MARRLLGAVLFAVVSASLVQAQIELSVTYQQREDQLDPNSPVQLRFTVSLESDTVEGDSRAWTAASVYIERLDSDGSVSESWIDTDPQIDAVGGVWIVSHADPSDPQTAEFSESPRIFGLASPVTGNAGTLEYSFQASETESSPAPEPPPGGGVAALTFYLQTVGQPGTIADGEDEPVEIPPDKPPPEE